MVNKYLTLASIPLLAVSLVAQATTPEQLNRQVKKLNQRISEQDQRFKLNGFATFGFTQSDEDMAYNRIGNDGNFNRLAKIGVQMTFNMDSQSSVVTQLVSRGENNWDTKAEWAYFKHDFNNGFSTKLGRIRLPAYQLSEFLDVGYANPYAQVPAETYDSLAPFSNIDGIDLSYTMDVGDNTLNLQLTHGLAKDDEFDLKDLIAINAVFQTDTWNSRLGYARASLDVIKDSTIEQALGAYAGDTTGIEGTFSSAGFTYDPGDLYFTAEATQLTLEGQLVDADAIYATVGYRIGRFFPNITFATAESTDDSERTLAAAAASTAYGSLAALQGLAGGGDATAIATLTALTTASAGLQAASNRNTQRIGLALKYDLSAGTALNVQYDIITVDDESGLFDDTAWATNAGSGLGANNPDSTNILTITIDTVF
jgi:hypothetical protein